VPLSAGIYLLCYLDRSNIGKSCSIFSFSSRDGKLTSNAVGNAKTLNASTRDDLLTETKMSNYQYV